MHENEYPLVSDPCDLRFQTLCSLQTHHGRSRTGLYLVEGIRHLAQAIEHRAAIHSVFYDPSILSNRFGQKLLRKLRRSGISGTRLSSHLYRQLTLAAEPQGIGAMVRQQWMRPSHAQPAGCSLWLGVESIESPGNLGTIIRTAEAVGVAGIFLIGSNVDPWDPAAVRASMGSLFSQKLVRCSPGEFVNWAKSSRVAVVGSSPSGLLDYRALRCRWPAALLVGSEKLGLSEHLIEASDFMVRIPMVGHCDSINVSVATGVLLFEMFAQRRGVPPRQR